TGVLVRNQQNIAFLKFGEFIGRLPFHIADHIENTLLREPNNLTRVLSQYFKKRSALNNAIEQLHIYKRRLDQRGSGDKITGIAFIGNPNNFNEFFKLYIRQSADSTSDIAYAVKYVFTPDTE